MHLAASSMTDGFACRTMLPNVSYGRSPWGEKIGPSPGPTRAAGVRLPSTASSPPPSSMTSTRRLGLPTCWRAYWITLPSALTNCCLGIGSLKASLTPLKRDQPSTKTAYPGPSPDAYCRLWGVSIERPSSQDSNRRTSGGSRLCYGRPRLDVVRSFADFDSFVATRLFRSPQRSASNAANLLQSGHAGECIGLRRETVT